MGEPEKKRQWPLLLPHYWGLGGLLLCAPTFAQPPPAQAPNTFGPPPSVTLTFGHLSGGLDNAIADDVHLDYAGELTVRAAHFQGNLDRSQFSASGGVLAHAHDTTVSAERLRADGLDHLGFADRATLTQRPYTIRARVIQFAPTQITAAHASLTTALPQDNPDFEVRATTLTITPEDKPGQPRTGRQKAVLHSASLYLFRTRILTLPRLTTTFGGDAASGAARRQTARRAVGDSGRYGPYAAFENDSKVGAFPFHYSLLTPLDLQQPPQVGLRAGQSLLRGPSLRSESEPPPLPPVSPRLATLRALTEAPTPRLPDGDPLLFHDFLPTSGPIRLFDQPSPAHLDVGEELSYHIEATGRGRNDLYVSRAPEINLSASIPLNRPYLMPPPGDPQAFRHFLSHLLVYANFQADAGRFREDPTGINATRQRETFSLSARPLLVAPNTFLLPGFAVTTNHYSALGHNRASGGTAYSYSQYSLALSHFFSDYSAGGVQYIVSQPHGDSPLNFDVLDTTRELDGRLQVGDRKLAVAASVRYDSLHPHVIDYTVAVAPGLRGFTPIISYSFFSRTFSVDLAIPGLTF